MNEREVRLFIASMSLSAPLSVSQALLFNSSGAVLYLVASILDVTSLHRARRGQHTFHCWAASTVTYPEKQGFPDFRAHVSRDSSRRNMGL